MMVNDETVATYRPSPKLMAALVAGNLLLAAACTFGLYRVYQLSQHPQITYIVPKIAAEPAASVAPAQADVLHSYDSKKLGVTFQYPVNWDVVEGTGISITSPDFSFHPDNLTDPNAQVVGNIIVNIDPDADGFTYSNGDVVADSVAVSTVLPGSSFKTRFISFTGDKKAGKLYFEAASDTGHTAFKTGQNLPDYQAFLKAVYHKYSIVAAYKEKNLQCQSAPCRTSVPVARIQSDPEFTQALEIMKTVSFKL